MPHNEPKIISYDIETLPNLAEVMKVYPGLSAYPGLTLKASITTVICFGFKVLGEDEVKCINAWDYEAWLTDVNNDYELVKAARDVLSSADAIVSHNGKRFDFKFLQTRLLFHGLDPLPKIPHIDTNQVLKSNMMIFNNRLGTAGKFLVKDEKLENGGWDLWVKVLNRDQEAMRLMEDYCKQDVILLEKIFLKLRPLINHIPNYNWFASEGRVCPKCGGTRLQKHSKRMNKRGPVQRYQCQHCGSICQENKKEELAAT